MAEIFEYTDPEDGYQLHAESLLHGVGVAVDRGRGTNEMGVLMGPDGVRRLRDALTAWLDDRFGAQTVAPDSLMDQLVRRAVDERLAAVLPLHIKQAMPNRCGAAGCARVDAHPTNECGQDSVPLADPEPQHVGRPEAPPLPVRTRPRLHTALAEVRCGECGHHRNSHAAKDPGLCFGYAGENDEWCTCTRTRAEVQP